MASHSSTRGKGKVNQVVQFQGELWESPGWVGLEWTGSKGREMKATCDYFKLSIFSNKQSLKEQIIA